MPRPPRVFVEGGIYHVYNRVTRGERVFGEDQEAALLLDAMRDARDRDGLIVLAWCILANIATLTISADRSLDRPAIFLSICM